MAACVRRCALVLWGGISVQEGSIVEMEDSVSTAPHAEACGHWTSRPDRYQPCTKMGVGRAPTQRWGESLRQQLEREPIENQVSGGTRPLITTEWVPCENKRVCALVVWRAGAGGAG